MGRARLLGVKVTVGRDRRSKPARTRPGSGFLLGPWLFYKHSILTDLHNNDLSSSSSVQGKVRDRQPGPVLNSLDFRARRPWFEHSLPLSRGEILGRLILCASFSLSKMEKVIICSP